MFDVLQVDPKTLVGDEQLGSKKKFWFARGEQLWLFKQARENTGEDWAEKVAGEIAYRLGIQAAHIELAEYLGHRGCACLSFVGADESLVHGNEILAGQILGYDRSKKLRQADHTLENIIAAVRKLVGEVEWYREVLEEIAPYLVLDALICNTDRHHENWGVLMTAESKVAFRIAPSFDHASSLGRELLPQRAAQILAAGRVGAYARRGHGGIYWSSTDPRGANPLQLVERAAAKYPGYFREALGLVVRTPVQELLAIVDEVPARLMAEPSREFAKALLSYTHAALAGLTP